jgi:hypothetical protein
MDPLGDLEQPTDTLNSPSQADFGPIISMSAEEKRLENLKKHYEVLLQNNTISNLDFKTIQEYNKWYKNNVSDHLNLNEYDQTNNYIKPLLDQLKKQFQEALKTKEFTIRTLGGSRRKQSSRRLRKTRQRRKMNNRKSKKSKQV